MGYNSIVGMFQGDLVIKEAIALAIEDLRKNPYVIEDIFRSLIENPFLKQKYGWKEIARAKEFILNNDIPIYMKHRIDKQEFPCITLSIGESHEDEQLATLGDLTTCMEEYTPSQIGQTISYIVPPFNPVSYNKDTGVVEVPENIEEYKYISEGMAVIDPSTGTGFTISGKAGTNGFQIAAGSELPSGQIGIIPQFQTFRARREKIISQEVYNIGCHVEGDPSTLIFLFSIVKYALYRYKEALLEYNNFQLSSLSSSDLIHNDAFGIENVYSRFIVLRGQTEESWIKTPYGFVSAIDIKDENEVFQTGIKILSQEAPENIEENPLWITIDDKT